jgi:hypothetical protein
MGINTNKIRVIKIRVINGILFVAGQAPGDAIGGCARFGGRAGHVSILSELNLARRVRQDEGASIRRHDTHRLHHPEHASEHRIRDRFAGRGVVVDTAAVEHQDAVGKHGREVEIMQDRDDGDAASCAAPGRFNHVELMAMLPHIHCSGHLPNGVVTPTITLRGRYRRTRR